MAGRAPAPRSLQHGRSNARFGVVAARFNEPIVKKLVDGAVAAFAAGGVGTAAIDVHWVPGSFEVPLAAQHLATSGRYAGIACVGVVIRGETPHFEHVAREAATGIRSVALATGIPVTFGLIVALTEQQAWARAGGDVGNRGAEAAEAALEMVRFLAEGSSSAQQRSTRTSARPRRSRDGARRHQR
jgi:6,7-dimethyl-8-ribityllumazine synthase